MICSNWLLYCNKILFLKRSIFMYRTYILVVKITDISELICCCIVWFLFTYTCRFTCTMWNRVNFFSCYQAFSCFVSFFIGHNICLRKRNKSEFNSCFQRMNMMFLGENITTLSIIIHLSSSVNVLLCLYMISIKTYDLLYFGFFPLSYDQREPLTRMC